MYYFYSAGQAHLSTPRGKAKPGQLVHERGKIYWERREKLRFTMIKKKRGQNFDKRLVREVLSPGHASGLGSDIQSVRQKSGPKSERAIQISAKATKEGTKPDDEWVGYVTMTRNRWVASEQHRADFFLNRGYFTNEGGCGYSIEGLFVLCGKTRLRQVPRNLESSSTMMWGWVSDGKF